MLRKDVLLRQDTEQLARLQHARDYAEDTTRDLQELHERLMESLETTGAVESGALEIALYKRAKNSMRATMRFIEDFEKAGGLTDGSIQEVS